VRGMDVLTAELADAAVGFVIPELAAPERHHCQET
jgi:hypothetical protein